MNSHANRGKPLEDLIEIQCSRYTNSGIAVFHKVPTKIIPLKTNKESKGFDGAYIPDQKKAVDFMGRIVNVPVAFDAKEMNEDRIRFDRLEPEQSEFLRKWHTGGYAVGFILIGYKLQRFWVFPWVHWDNYMQHATQKSLSILDLDRAFTEYEIPQRGTGSVNIDFVTKAAEIFAILLPQQEYKQ
jgi:penicillin-binding protein-related factor A (putative recombinase)